MVAMSTLAAAAGRADMLESFNFTGTLATPDMGDSTVTGSFTLDTSGAGSVTAFDFSTPIGTISQSAGWASSVTEYLPAISPPADIVEIFFKGEGGMALLFETSLAPFSGSTFYTGQVQLSPMASYVSSIACNIGPEGGCGLYGSLFTSGSATPVSTAAPEPRLSFLLGAVLLGFAAVLGHRPRKSAER